MADRRSQEAARNIHAHSELSLDSSPAGAASGEAEVSQKRKLFESWLSSVTPRAALTRDSARPAAEEASGMMQQDGESTQIYKQGSQDALLHIHSKRTDPPPPRADERTAVFRVPPELLALSIQSMNEQGAAVDPQALLAAGESAMRPDPAEARRFSDDEHTKVTPMTWPRGEDGESLPFPAAAQLLVAQARSTRDEDVHSDASIELHGSSEERDSLGVQASDAPELTVPAWRRNAAWLLLVAVAAGAAFSVRSGHGEPLHGWVKRVGSLVTR
jgi:hypothetical protein